MKTRNNLFLITALCLAIFCLGACEYFNGADGQGSIVINLDNSGARAYAVDTDEMTYTITPTNGKTTIKPITTSEASISISVPEGTWNIKVDAEGKRVRGVGDTDVVVTAGQSSPANIKMKVTGTRVSTWNELKDVFDELNKTNGKLKDLKEIEIIAEEELDATSGLSLSITKEIRLWAKNDVTIKRGVNQKEQPVFTITNCTLILDGTKGKKIEINGNKDGITGDSSSRALINVMENSTLRMLDGVTITNNVSSSSTGGGFGGGIYVENGKFYMEGGIISNNRAGTNGGGVYVNDRNNKRNGIFEKTGGTIYGYTERDDNSNKVESNGRIDDNGGHAVYDKGRISNTTLGTNAPWPQN